MVKKKEDDFYLNLVFFMLLIALVFSFFAMNLRISVLKAPPSFHEFYGSIVCSNGANINGKVINITIYGSTNNISSTTIISNNYYSILAQGYDTNSPTIFRIDNIIVQNTTYTPFSFEERNITLSDATLCPTTSPPPSGGGGGGGGGGGATGGGGGGFPSSSNITLAITSNPTDANIYINNILYGITPKTISLAKGSYTIRLEKEGYITYEEINNYQSSTTISPTLEEVQQPNPVQAIVTYFAKEPLFILNLIIVLLLVGSIGFAYFYIKRTKSKKQ